jgi:hypothetical protein
MARMLVVAFAVIGLFASDAEAARRRGLLGRWSARRAARLDVATAAHVAPQAIWNTYYRALVRHDWDTAYRCLDRDSREHAVANAAFCVIWFSSDDATAGAAAHLARRHQLNVEAIVRDFDESLQSYTPIDQQPSQPTDDVEEMKAFSKVKARLLRHIPDHAAFYRDAMQALTTLLTDDSNAAPSPNSASLPPDPPRLSDFRFKGKYASASYPTDPVAIDGQEFSTAQSVEFTFERGGWRIRELDW